MRFTLDDDWKLQQRVEWRQLQKKQYDRHVRSLFYFTLWSCRIANKTL